MTTEKGISSISFVRASSDDVDELVESRMEVMREVWDLSAEQDMTRFSDETRDYYERAIPAGTHAAFMAYDGPAFVGCAGISYYRVMPTVDNPTGRKAYVMNMYVRAAYRRIGVASRLLELLLDDAKAKGVDWICLEASEDGKPFYAARGFVPMPDEMMLEPDPVGSHSARMASVDSEE